jgi:hypothetical protein
MRVSCRLAVSVFLIAAALVAQRRVDPRNTYYRVIAVLPLVGSGAPTDPVRPKHAPHAVAGRTVPEGIIAFAFQPSDDGKHAIAEFVAIDRAALADVLDDKGPDVTVFEKDKARRADIETALRRFKKNFDLDRFGVAVQ